MDGRSPQEQRAALTRRAFLGGGLGLGTAALASLLGPGCGGPGAAGDAAPERWRGVLGPPDAVPRARRAIFLYMAGGPSQFESFDYKPRLAQMNGQPIPESLVAGQPIAQLQFAKQLLCMGPHFPFERHGRSGAEISSLFPHIGSIADDICIVRSMQTEHINHAPAHTFMNTGTPIAGRPSLGSWLLYGLGSETQDLPGFVVMTTTWSPNAEPISSNHWASGFLPSRFQGVKFYGGRDPVLYVRTPAGVDREGQANVVEAVRDLDGMASRTLEDPEVEARVSQYETAFRMQTSVPELVDLSDEPDEILELYGVERGARGFAGSCLLGRRLLERGVRFVQIYSGSWDHHAAIKGRMEDGARAVDRASAALVRDLAQRGMLDDTLVIWGGEFGRTPMAQGDGRDHHIRGYSMWLAGGGVKAGLVHGRTDELGYHAVEDPVHVHDLHATLLHLLGIDHERLTYRHQGRDFRLTDVHGKRVHAILA